MVIELFSHPSSWLSLLALCGLEIVLGIDNLVFISIAVSRLPKHQQNKARRIGLGLALILRLGLLSMAAWLITFTQPLFTLFSQPLSARDLFLLLGGLFLIVKATNEIHVGFHDKPTKPSNPSFRKMSYVITQIILLDMVFSFDSIMTAVGLTNNFLIMSTAIIIAVILMIVASEPVGNFINKYPSLRMLALSFLMLIGVVLFADGLHFDMPRGYIYFAMLFSLAVEILNILSGRRKRETL